MEPSRDMFTLVALPCIAHALHMFTRSESPLAKSTGTCLLHAVAGLYAVLEPEGRSAYERIIPMLDAILSVKEETRHVSATSPDLCAAFGEAHTSCIFGLMSSTTA